MKKIILGAITLAFLGTTTIAQQKLLTMEEAVVKQRTTLAPANMKDLQWIKGTNDFSYLDKKGDEDVLMRGNAEKKDRKAIVSLVSLNAALKKVSLDTLFIFPSVSWENSNEFDFMISKKWVGYNTSKASVIIKEIRDYGEDAENIDIEPLTHRAAFTIKNNLFISDGKTKTQITNDVDSNIVNGKSVHREEFGIDKGTFWSTKGTYLAFYRMDQTMVTDYPIIDWTTRPAHANEIKYPMAGDKSHHVTVGVYDVAAGKKIFLQTGEPAEQYLTNIAWSPDEQHIYIAVLNRDQNHLQFNSYNSRTGAFEKTLFEETSDKYVQPLHPMLFAKNPRALLHPIHPNPVANEKNVPDAFIWQSARDGWNQLYLYDEGGTLEAQLTKGEWEVTDLLGFDESGENVLFMANKESPIDRDLYMVNITSGNITRLTSGDATHTVKLNENGNYFIDTYSAPAIPRVVSVVNNKGKIVQPLLTADNPLKDYKLGQVSIFKLKSGDNEDLYCRMFKPINFDSTKKYPAIVYVYGGPNVQLISNSWNGGGDMWFQYMAERGFVIFTLDNRGTDNRGLKFEQATFRHLGTEELKDQLVGVNYLKHLRFVDSTRLGIFGWSYGGFMTTSMMTRYPNVFKVAVAGGPVIDWSYYEVMYTERYMDTPQDNPEGYKESRVLNYVPNLNGKLLVIHGTQDPIVVWQHSIMFLKAAVDAGKQVDYFVYPGHEHNVLGKDRVNLMQKVADYFMENL